MTRAEIESIGFRWDFTHPKFSAMSEEMYNKWINNPIDEEYINTCIDYCIGKAGEDMIMNHY